MMQHDTRTCRKSPETDLEILGVGFWLLAKPILWAAAVQGRLMDRRNRALNGED